MRPPSLKILLRLSAFCPSQERRTGSPAHPVVRGNLRRRSQWEHHPEYRALGGGLLDGYVTSVILNNLLHHCQPQPGGVFLLLANEGFVELAATRFWDAMTVIADANLRPIPSFPQLHH